MLSYGRNIATLDKLNLASCYPRRCVHLKSPSQKDFLRIGARKSNLMCVVLLMNILNKWPAILSSGARVRDTPLIITLCCFELDVKITRLRINHTDLNPRSVSQLRMLYASTSRIRVKKCISLVHTRSNNRSHLPLFDRAVKKKEASIMIGLLASTSLSSR